ncbi:MAG: TIGR01459 family HAD-type hydrolase [Alphaproteobacteria bacterium]
MSATTFADRLRDVAERYQGFIIDQWGVLHDGGEPYPGAVDCLTRLRAEGKRIVLLSNSGKRAAFNTRRLVEMGYDEALYDAAVTSGEACWLALRDRDTSPFDRLGRRCYLWGRGGDRSHVEGIDLEVVEDAEQADFLYLAGVPDYAEIEPYLPVLEVGARRGVPLICANPDIVAIYPNGGRGMAPGGVARRYEEMGGTAIYVGKPHRPVYELCLKHLAGLPRDGILGIGDSLQHDIAGGNGVGIDTMLLTHGVHHDAFDGAEDDAALQAALDRLEQTYATRPRWVLPSFIW